MKAQYSLFMLFFFCQIACAVETSDNKKKEEEKEQEANKKSNSHKVVRKKSLSDTNIIFDSQEQNQSREIKRSMSEATIIGLKVEKQKESPQLTKLKKTLSLQGKYFDETMNPKNLSKKMIAQHIKN